MRGSRAITFNARRAVPGVTLPMHARPTGLCVAQPAPETGARLWSLRCKAVRHTRTWREQADAMLAQLN